jgi:phenylalanyl-tRNA synthetase beta chain
MLLSLEWLAEYLDISEFTSTQISEFLTDLGIEVEGEQSKEALDDKIVVAKISSVEKHPNASSLSVCTVDVGASVDLTIVCGAKNVKKDLFVAVSLIGSRLPDGFVIKEANLRGVKSSGMICSERELGISDEHDGIIELDLEGLKVGHPLGEYVNCKDSILDLSITPNRGDCLSYLGVARDLAAKLKKKVKKVNCDIDSVKSNSRKVSVVNEVADHCRRFSTVVVSGIKCQESPLWLKRRLLVSGIRSKNIIVDITNYVLLESGQPIHAYDLSKVTDDCLYVKQAKHGQEILVIDEKKIKCEDKDLLICDNKTPLALAGVMGGLDSAVKDSTSDIIIEVAHFNPATVRNTSKRLAIFSESSHRFERGIDLENIGNVSKRVAFLIADLSFASVKEKISIGEINDCYFNKLSSVEIEFDVSKAQALLGLNITKESCIENLSLLGCGVFESDKNKLSVRPPSWRNDLHLSVDLIEEVVRLEGFDKIEPQTPDLCGSLNQEDPLIEYTESVRAFFASSGLNEIITYPFSSQKQYMALSLDENHFLMPNVVLKNPLNEQNKWFRTSLLPDLLHSVVKCRHRRQFQVKMFEIARGYFDKGKSKEKLSEGSLWAQLLRKEKHFTQKESSYVERSFLSGVLDSPVQETSWQRSKPLKSSFFVGKELLAQFLLAFNIKNITWKKISEKDFPFLNPRASACLFFDDLYLGWLGELHPNVSLAYDLGIENIPVVFELDLERLSDLVCVPKFSGYKINKFPAVTRDISLEMKDDMSYADLSQLIKKCDKINYLCSFNVFDIYKGEGLKEGHKSLALRFVFQSEDKTLTDKEIDKSITSLVSFLAKNNIYQR